MGMARSMAKLETDFMNSLKLLFKRETFMPLVAMTFASAVCVAVVLPRIAWTGKIRYGFLAWNLFLAWLPLLFALLARENYRDGEKPGWRFLGFSAAWLLFFPNAPYIFTDLIHLTSRYFSHFWVDLAVILSCAFTGLVLGFVSLYLMHSVVTRMLGADGGLAVCGGRGGTVQLRDLSRALPAFQQLGRRRQAGGAIPRHQFRCDRTICPSRPFCLPGAVRHFYFHRLRDALRADASAADGALVSCR